MCHRSWSNLIHVNGCQLLSSPLGYLLSGTFKCPSTPLFLLLCLFFEFPISLLHHPLPVFPSILPFILSLCRESPLITCPIQFFCLIPIRSIIKDLFSSTSVC